MFLSHSGGSCVWGSIGGSEHMLSLRSSLYLLNLRRDRNQVPCPINNKLQYFGQPWVPQCPDPKALLVGVCPDRLVLPQLLSIFFSFHHTSTPPKGIGRECTWQIHLKPPSFIHRIEPPSSWIIGGHHPPQHKNSGLNSHSFLVPGSHITQKSNTKWIV